MIERRVTTADGMVAVDERGNPLPASMTDEAMKAYMDSLRVPQELRARVRMTLLGQKSDIPSVEGAEHRSDFDADEWMTQALRRSAAVQAEIDASR